jgi:hypothetical protein
VDLGRQVQPDGSGWVQLALPADAVWLALDQAGMAAQLFAKRYKHQREKCSLGLPRLASAYWPPGARAINPPPGVRDRHASPVHYHLHQVDKAWVLRVAAFPAARLPTVEESTAMLRELLHHFQSTFPPGG